MSARIEERRAQLQKLVDMAMARQASAASPLEASDTMISQMIGAAIVESLIDIAAALARPTDEIAMRQPKELPSLDAPTLMGVPVRNIPLPILRAWAADDRDTVMIWIDKHIDEREQAEALAKEIGPITPAPAAREFKTVAGKRDFKPATQANRNEAELAAMRDAIAEQSGEVVERPARQLHPGMPLCPHNNKSIAGNIPVCDDCGKEFP